MPKQQTDYIWSTHSPWRNILTFASQLLSSWRNPYPLFKTRFLVLIILACLHIHINIRISVTFILLLATTLCHTTKQTRLSLSRIYLLIWQKISNHTTSLRLLFIQFIQLKFDTQYLHQSLHYYKLLILIIKTWFLRNIFQLKWSPEVLPLALLH